ncbi:MAG: PfkB family carbohydrate kinase [Actinomycetota bacterium]
MTGRAGGVVLTVGDLVLDVAVDVGSDLVPRGDTTSTVHVRRGGSAANVAVAVVDAGGAARFAGAVGDDAAGRLAVGELVDAGVDVHVERRGRTGTVVALVDPHGERSMLTDRGAADSLAELPTRLLDDVGAVHVPAYGLLGGGALAEASRAALRRAPDGAWRSVDASSVSLLDHTGVQQLGSSCHELAVDVLVANVDEATALGWPDSWMDHVPVRIVKLGPDGAELLSDGGRTVVPTEAIRGVDTTGAGDAFAGGLLAALVRGSGVEDAVRYGHAAASRLLRARRDD